MIGRFPGSLNSVIVAVASAFAGYTVAVRRLPPDDDRSTPPGLRHSDEGTALTIVRSSLFVFPASVPVAVPFVSVTILAESNSTGTDLNVESLSQHLRVRLALFGREGWPERSETEHPGEQNDFHNCSWQANSPGARLTPRACQ